MERRQEGRTEVWKEKKTGEMEGQEEWIDWKTTGRKEGSLEGRQEGRRDGRTGGMNRRKAIGRKIDGWMDGRQEGRTD